MSIILSSLKYNVGLKKEILLLSREMKNISNVHFVGSRLYNFSEDSFSSVSTVTCGGGTKDILWELIRPFRVVCAYLDIIKDTNAQYLCFYNTHPLNVFVLLFVRLYARNCIGVIYLHEPYKDLGQRLLYGPSKAVYFTVVNWVNYLSLVLAKRIVTLSPHGTYLLKERYEKNISKVEQASILLDAAPDLGNSVRRYFTFVGNINSAKGFGDFLNLVLESLQRKDDLEFCLVTSSSLASYKHVLDGIPQSKLKVVNEKNLTDSLICEIINKSLAVLVLHTVAAQSGVMPLAYSMKTPVIYRSLPAFTQNATDIRLGLSIEFNSDEILQVCKRVKHEFSYGDLQDNVYSIYNNTFHPTNFLRYYSWMVKKN